MVRVWPPLCVCARADSRMETGWVPVYCGDLGTVLGSEWGMASRQQRTLWGMVTSLLGGSMSGHPNVSPLSSFSPLLSGQGTQSCTRWARALLHTPSPQGLQTSAPRTPCPGRGHLNSPSDLRPSQPPPAPPAPPALPHHKSSPTQTKAITPEVGCECGCQRQKKGGKGGGARDTQRLGPLRPRETGKEPGK